MQLANGESLPIGKAKGEWVSLMLEDGIIVATAHGSRKTIRAVDVGMFVHYIESRYNVRDLVAYKEMLLSENVNRATQVEVAGDSKAIKCRTFSGFLVNSYDKIDARLNGHEFLISPQNGSFVFVYDYKTFEIASNVVIVGVENAENFRYIEQQRWLFDSVIPSGYKVLFVCRYPLEQSKDLISWLQSIPNHYIHFGDLDLAGINIYLTEFECYLKDRASFLIPEDYDTRIQNGSIERYNTQLPKYGSIQCDNPRILALIASIHRNHRGYDQEGFIHLDNDLRT
jgi:hypothetical protein